MGHEIPAAFAREGLPLARTLVDMLDDHVVHRTVRRGCGFTQSTRFLADCINQPRDPVDVGDLKVFRDWPCQATRRLAVSLVGRGWSAGWRDLDAAPDDLFAGHRDDDLGNRLRRLPARLRRIRGQLAHAESGLFMDLLINLVTGQGPAAPTLHGMPEKPDIGSCSQAEEFFLEIAHGRVRRGGSVNVVVDADGRPLMVEKMQLGESHSAIVVAPIRIFDVWIPPGGLCALRYSEPVPAARGTRHGLVIPLAHIDCARFLRLTTLSVDPSIRVRAFEAQVRNQLESDMFSPLTTRIEQLHAFATSLLREAG